MRQSVARAFKKPDLSQERKFLNIDNQSIEFKSGQDKNDRNILIIPRWLPFQRSQKTDETTKSLMVIRDRYRLSCPHHIFFQQLHRQNELQQG